MHRNSRHLHPYTSLTLLRSSLLHLVLNKLEPQRQEVQRQKTGANLQQSLRRQAFLLFLLHLRPPQNSAQAANSSVPQVLSGARLQLPPIRIKSAVDPRQFRVPVVR